MAEVESQMVALGTQAPHFDLPIANPSADSSNKETRSLDDYDRAQILVVVFTCNHCPFAKHVENALNTIALDYRSSGVQLVAINPNDAETYPADSFENMAQRAAEKGFTFPYLRDESQEVAKAYGAVCTPDTFVYDSDRKLTYRGQIDSTRPGGDPANGSDLRKALDKVLQGDNPSEPQVPSVGCSIKWKK